MPLPPLLCMLAAAFVAPGQSVDNAADDRALFAKAESATANLAESGKSPLTKAARLEQCKRTMAAGVFFV